MVLSCASNKRTECDYSLKVLKTPQHWTISKTEVCPLFIHRSSKVQLNIATQKFAV
jgi:hypothetical protein